MTTAVKYEIVVPSEFFLLTEYIPPYKREILLLTKTGEYYLGCLSPAEDTGFANFTSSVGNDIPNVIAWNHLPTIYLREI